MSGKGGGSGTNVICEMPPQTERDTMKMTQETPETAGEANSKTNETSETPKNMSCNNNNCNWSNNNNETCNGKEAASLRDSGEREYREKLIKMVKKEVKQLMEEAVTRKFVHEESSCITALCATVDACLSHGLKRRALGLFKTNSTTALMQKVAKNFEPAANILKMVEEIERNDPNKKSSSSSDSTSKLYQRASSFVRGTTASVTQSTVTGTHSAANGTGPASGGQNNSPPANKALYSNATRYLWIRVSIFEKKLVPIINHLVSHASLYYEREALVSDPVLGEILASLLVGPCALDFSKMKTQDHYWTDPPADELVQRHRLGNLSLGTGCGATSGAGGTMASSTSSCPNSATPPSGRKPLAIFSYRSRSNTNSGSGTPATSAGGQIGTGAANEETLLNGGTATPPKGNGARDYVESLHQNSRSTLLYGKNNVIVQVRENMEPLPGYLSLHTAPTGLVIKWTPNQLMNTTDAESTPADKKSPLRSPTYGASNSFIRESNGLMIGREHEMSYWDVATVIPLDTVVYLHCHVEEDKGGSIVLVGVDGVQRAPFRFPSGGHLLAFLSCLETGLASHCNGAGSLDPPLWSQKGKGKIFPKLKRRYKVARIADDGDEGKQIQATTPGEEAEVTDYVFRIVHAPARSDTITSEMFDPRSGGASSSTQNSSPSSTLKSAILDRLPWNKSSSVSSCQEAADHSRGSHSRVLQEAHDSTSSTSSSKSITEEQYALLQAKMREKELNLINQCDARQQAPQLESVGHKSSIELLCDTMKRQLMSRAFYGWLAHMRHLRTVRTHLAGLVHSKIVPADLPTDASVGLRREMWESLHDSEGRISDALEVQRLVYYGGVEHNIRRHVWPYLLAHYDWGATTSECRERDRSVQNHYETTMSEWLAVEVIVRQRDKEIMAANLAKLSSESTSGSGSTDVAPTARVSKSGTLPETGPKEADKKSGSHSSVIRVVSGGIRDDVPESVANMSNEVFEVADEEAEEAEEEEEEDDDKSVSEDESVYDDAKQDQSACDTSDKQTGDEKATATPKKGSVKRIKRKLIRQDSESASIASGSVIVTNPSIDQSPSHTATPQKGGGGGKVGGLCLERLSEESEGLRGGRSSACPSPVSSNGGVYTNELLDLFSLNLHRIDKDVQRCDRNYWYFTTDNLDKLRNVMCTYVWEHLDVGYVQGMCDLAAPLLVIFNDEVLSYNCFCELMRRMVCNFPQGGAMDEHFAHMRSLIQILDGELFDLMVANGDYTHFHFCYRWFLLDFKREFVYEDVFSVWEVIWSSRSLASNSFVLFLALALVQIYREIILENNMDFTDIIKFFNEMAERHDAKAVLNRSRHLVYQIQLMIDESGK